MFKSFWYKSLIKPFLAPPDWVFAPAWIFLYSFIAISLVLYITKPSKIKFFGYVYFGIQMILNLAWTPAFFGLQNMRLGLVIIILLDIFVILTVREFYSVSKHAAILLIPYLLWIIFATYLNIGYLILNG